MGPPNANGSFPHSECDTFPFSRMGEGAENRKDAAMADVACFFCFCAFGQCKSKSHAIKSAQTIGKKNRPLRSSLFLRQERPLKIWRYNQYGW